MSKLRELKDTDTKPCYLSRTFDQSTLNSKVMPDGEGRSVLGSGCSSSAALCFLQEES